MVKRITPEQVEEFVVNGLRKANRHYCELSGGEWITGRGVESFLSYFITGPFLKFFSRDKACIRLEVTRKEFEEDYIEGRKLSGKKSPGSRFDIVILKKRGLLDCDVIGVIELKRQGYGYESDIDRVASALDDCRSMSAFQFGCFAALVSEWEGEKHTIDDQLKRWIPVMTAVKKRKRLELHVFDASITPFERYRYRNGKGEPDEGRVRSGVVGCVFYR